MTGTKRTPPKLKPDAELIDKIKRMAGRPNGLTIRALHDVMCGGNRPLARALMEAMVAAKELHPASRGDISGESPLVKHHFLTAEAASAWLAAPRADVQEWLRQPVMNNRAETRRSDAVGNLRRTSEAKARDAGRPVVTIRVDATVDMRYAVTGPVPRVITGKDCSPWAAAVAGGGNG